MWIPIFLIISIATGMQVGHTEADPVATEDECAQTLTKDRPMIEMFVQSHLGEGYELKGDCKEAGEPL